MEEAILKFSSSSLLSLSARSLCLAMAPKRRRPKAKAKARLRQQQMDTANSRQMQRRAALSSLNNVVKELHHENLCVTVKQPDPKGVDALLRFLARREFDAPLALKCKEAVEKYTANGGKLPEGMTLAESGSGLSRPIEDGPSVVPRHKVLKTHFTLKSRAFMVTFNSTLFVLNTWGAFLTWVKN